MSALTEAIKWTYYMMEEDLECVYYDTEAKAQVVARHMQVFSEELKIPVKWCVKQVIGDEEDDEDNETRYWVTSN